MKQELIRALSNFVQVLENGLLVGVNGRGKYQRQFFRSAHPSVKEINPYGYMDGTEPPLDFQKQLEPLAWAIPIETYLKYKPENPFDSLYFLNLEHIQFLDQD